MSTQDILLFSPSREPVLRNPGQDPLFFSPLRLDASLSDLLPPDSFSLAPPPSSLRGRVVPAAAAAAAVPLEYAPSHDYILLEPSSNHLSSSECGIPGCAKLFNTKKRSYAFYLVKNGETKQICVDCYSNQANPLPVKMKCSSCGLKNISAPKKNPERERDWLSKPHWGKIEGKLLCPTCLKKEKLRQIPEIPVMARLLQETMPVIPLDWLLSWQRLGMRIPF